MKKIFTFLILASLTFAQELSSLKFLEKVRNPKITNAWAKMEGEAVHKRDAINTKENKQDSIRTSAKIYTGMRFRDDKMDGKVLFDENELYSIGQNFTDGIAGSVSKKDGCLKQNADKMAGIFGLSSSDLTLSFLFWDFAKEHKKENVRLLYECRVFELKNSNLGESVKVWIYPDWLAPLKVQWFKNGEKDPYREAEFTEVKKMENDLYLIESFVIKGNSWKTQVKFEKMEAAKMDEKKIPADIFPQLKK